MITVSVTTNLNVAVNGTIQNGESFLIRPNLRAVDNIKVSIQNTGQISTADRLQIEGAIANSRETEPSLQYDMRAKPLKENAQFDTGTILGVAQTKTFKSNTVEPALFIPRDVAGFSVSIQPPIVNDHQLQLFTSEYNHIVGSNTLAAPFASGLATSTSIESGTTFINDYVNKQGATGYKDTSITLGNFASGVSLSDGLPIQTNSSGGPQNLIAANALKLNGTNLASAYNC